MSIYHLLILLLIANSHLTPLQLNFTVSKKSLISYIEAVPQLQIDYSSQALTTQLCFGAVKQCFSVLINLSIHHTWVTDITNADRQVNSKFDESRSNTCKPIEKKEIQFENGNMLKGKVLEDKLWLGELQIEKIRFFSASNSEDFPGVEGMLGLGYSPNRDEEFYALRTQLLNSRVMQQMAFTVEFTDTKKGVLSLGHIPREIMQYYTHYGNCPIAMGSLSKKNSNWECALHSMSFGKQHNEEKILRFNEGVVKFDLATDKTLFPIFYLLQLEKMYFQKAIENGDCNFGIKNNYYTYTCLEANLPEFQEFSLVFNEWAIHVPFENLFVYDAVDKEYEFVIYTKDGYDGFVIGTNIMRHFQMVFDEESQMIGFYNSSPQFLIRISDEPVRPPKGFEEGRPDKPLQPLQPVPGDKENKGNPEEGKDKPIPLPSRGFFSKFFSSLGIIALIFSLLFVSWIGFRYFRRRKYNDPSFYYKATDSLFDEGTRIE